ncbi:MAG TPA: aldehyde dehydrogenase [Parafilimonas sp.]|nr:aldehyde dehydrogenase [Parafilimonas sp.]
MIQAVSEINIIDQLESMRNFFKTNAAKEYAFRKRQLLNLKRSILKYEEELYKCLYIDLKKNKEEVWVTEIGFVIAEINATLKNLHDWMRRKKTGTNLLNLPSAGFLQPEPLGVVLIVAPWNYPFQLLFTPLVGAIAAGNCIVLKASEFAPATSDVMKHIIEDAFSREYIFYAEGEGVAVIPPMMEHFKFDHVFYTGSTATGRMIYKMAAENLVPVTLELGGKSPCIVESDANITVAARRIAMTKFSNAGQMCVAPDYLLVHASVKEAFINQLTATIEKFFTTDAANNYNYGKIINERQFDRLVKYLGEGRIIYGGKTDREKLFIAPTIIDSISVEDDIMKEEIFGPILPVISFNTADEAQSIIEKNPEPLALYVYTASREKENYWLDNIAFGGGCINNSAWHLTNYYLPFGGRGNSGIGRYHGKYSFETFSHYKAIMKTPSWFDPALRYPPFKGKLNIFKKIVS